MKVRVDCAQTARRCAQVGEECAPTSVRSGEELGMRAVCAQSKKSLKMPQVPVEVRVDCA